MANIADSYNRFTALPANISEFGMTAEEFKIQHGQPDPNPVLSPMAAPEVAQVRLSLSPSGSDNLRLGEPGQPAINPYEGPKSTLVLSRNAVTKLSGNVIVSLGKLVEAGGVAEGNVQALMKDSIGRVNGLREFIAHLNTMAESVMVRSLAASKG